MTQIVEIVRQARENGRVEWLDAAIDAAKHYGHDELVPALQVLRDWPRAGASTRQTREDRMFGKIARLVGDKGFGFIKPDSGGGKDIFFHRSGVGRGVNFDTLKEGDRVRFEEGESQKGPRAEGVELA